MKKTDLRIGNYVEFILPKNIAEITEIFIGGNDDYCLATNINSERGLEDYNPIKLTTDWLVKFGFDKTLDNWYGGEGTHVHGTVIWLKELNYDDKFRVYLTETVISYVKYVHELQNLYHGLTGNELKVKD